MDVRSAILTAAFGELAGNVGVAVFSDLAAVPEGEPLPFALLESVDFDRTCKLPGYVTATLTVAVLDADATSEGMNAAAGAVRKRLEGVKLAPVEGVSFSKAWWEATDAAANMDEEGLTKAIRVRVGLYARES